MSTHNHIIQSGRGRHLALSEQTLWDELYSYSFDTAAATYEVPGDVAQTVAQCSGVCSAEPRCTAWRWDPPSGTCELTHETLLSWTYANSWHVARTVTGRFRSCAGLAWTEARTTAFHDFPSHDLPTATQDPFMWMHTPVTDPVACAAMCRAQAGCLAWTWYATYSKCLGRRTPVWSRELVSEGIISGTTSRCVRYPSVSLVAVPGRVLSGTAHARALCAQVSGVVAELRDERHLRWLATEVGWSAFNDTRQGGVPLAVRGTGGAWTTLGGRDASSLLSSVAAVGRWAAEAVASGAAEGSFLGLELASGNSTLVAWGAGEQGAAAVLCEHGSGVRYAAQGANGGSEGGGACTGSSEDRCANWCRNGACDSAWGPCVCHAGYYPPNDCSNSCLGGELMRNGTVCEARAVMSVKTTAVAATPGTASLGIDAAEAIGVPGVPMLHTTAFHVRGVRGGYALKVVRARGKSCTEEPRPTRPISGSSDVAYVGRTESADECSELVDSRFVDEVAFLWDTTGTACYATRGDLDFTQSSASASNSTVCRLVFALVLTVCREIHATQLVGCKLLVGTSNDVQCNARPHTPFMREPEARSGAVQRGPSEAVYHVTMDEPGHYLLCHRPFDGLQPPRWFNTGEFAVRAWTCAERRQLIPSTSCQP